MSFGAVGCLVVCLLGCLVVGCLVVWLDDCWLGCLSGCCYVRLRVLYKLYFFVFVFAIASLFAIGCVVFWLAGLPVRAFAC